MGFGTYKVTAGEAKAAVLGALEIGYRHIDTAQMYGNEKEVGEAIAESGIDRADIFLTTKLDNPNHEPAVARESFARSLDDLGVEYVDLFLMHWPLPMMYDGDFPLTYRVMEEFAADGRARSIGVSNFEVAHLERLAAEASIVPAVNQIELHPFFQNRTVAAYCNEHGIAVEAWAPIARGAVVDDRAICEVAERAGCTPSQATLAWHLQRGRIVFPKSVHRERQEENFAATGITLTADDLAILDSLDRGEAGRTGYHPDTMTRHS